MQVTLFLQGLAYRVSLPPDLPRPRQIGTYRIFLISGGSTVTGSTALLLYKPPCGLCEGKLWLVIESVCIGVPWRIAMH